MPEDNRYQPYEVLKQADGTLWELGRGAMGITYKAYDTRLHRAVALKVINANHLENEGTRQRFVREARATAALRHENVASIFHLGTEEGNYFYAMEFIDGETVEEWMKRKGRLEPVEAFEIALQVTSALVAAAKQQLVHRDLKPANLMLAEEDGKRVVKVIDFGLAKRVRREETEALSAGGGFFGTPHFASPEQLNEGELDVRSDIYSLGATLYYLVAGRPPFSGALVQIMSQHLSKPVPKEALVESCPPVCVDLILQMMEKEPEKRPRTPSELRDKIEKCLQVLKPERLLHPVQGLKYRLDEPISDHVMGKYHRGLDLDRLLTVGLLILREELAANPLLLAQLEQAVDRVCSSPHPELRRIFGIKAIANQKVLVDEFVIAPSLRDVLRARGSLSPTETALVINRLASVVAHAIKHRLENVNLTLGGVQLCDPAQGQDSAELKFWADKLLTEWPELTVRVAPIDFEFAGQPVDVSLAGGVTLSPGVGSLKPKISYVKQLGLLAYELLEGPRATLEAQGRYVPLPALSEEGNRVLKRAVADEIGTPELFAHSFAASVEASRGERRDESAANAPSSDPPLEKREERKRSWRGKPRRWSAAVLVFAGLVGYGFYHFIRPQPGAHPRDTSNPGPATSAPISAPTPDPFDQQRAEVDQFLRTGNWQSAVTAGADLVERYPSRDEPRQKLTTLLSEAQNDLTRINEENFSVVRPTLERAARLGIAPAMFLLAEHLKTKDPDAALAWYEQLAATGDRGAMVQAGLLYSNDRNPEGNRKALDYFTKAADAGDPEGNYYAGESLYDPKPGVLRDEVKALKYLGEAEFLGEPRSMNLLGLHYRKLHRYEEARHFLEEGVRAGSPVAMANLGLMYMNGEQMTRDPKKGAELFRQAAELGDDSGMYRYGQCFFYGVGMPHDLLVANDWFRKAARAGNSAAIDYCSRNEIEYR
jgi:TPR repeat protein/tRNA A-37 threonylcarbamoyl transferase component Bud32